MVRIGILISGRGSNLLAIGQAIRDRRLSGAEISVVLSNREDATGVMAARELGIQVEVVPSKGRERVEHDAQLIALLRRHSVDLVCLAGYMRLLSPSFTQAFPERILNIHPSLLPAFPGLEAQQQALQYGAKITGCTVHFVDEHLDHGVIVAQRTVSVEDDETVSTLSARILEQEHIAYPEAIQHVIGGQYEIHGRTYRRRSTEVT